MTSLDASQRHADAVTRMEAGVLIAVVRTDTTEQALGVTRALVRGGIKLIEITMTIPRGVDVLATLVSESARDVLLGAGSVVKAEQALAVTAAGARFVVSPVLAAEIAPVAAAAGAACVLGAFSPSEMVQATAAGADFVKVFPADAAGGPSYFRAVLAPLPHLRLLPSGGVRLENLVTYLEAGAVALALGSDLAPGVMVKAGDWDAIAARAEKYVEALAAWRSSARP